MRFAGFSALMLAGALVAAYLLAFVHPFGDAGLSSQLPARQNWGKAAMPAEVHALLGAKCGDCHGGQTRVPVYAHFAPASWLIESDVMRARHAMDLSHWDDEAAGDRQVLIAKIARVAKRREMPPVQYLLLHWNAHLTDGDLRLVADWAQRSASDSDAVRGGAVEQGDAVRGKLVFERRCTGCHALERDREGPRLKGVFGRTAATVSGYDYSPALKNSRIVWNEATLERWLADPDAMVPASNMDFHVANAQERRDIIEFLREHSGQAGR